jgi:RNA recognition motif-containing protein
MFGKRGSMMLFLRGLPEDVTQKELRAFVQEAVRPRHKRSFSLKAAVSNCTILRITDQTNGATEHHGLVEIHPAKAAIGAIETLNGKTLKGASIEVRRYHHRTPLRDRRRNRSEQDYPDQRKEDRRRRFIKIDLVGT